VISWDETAGRYAMRSYANGQVTDVPFEGGPDGFRWTVPSRGGPVNYVTTHQNGDWVEVGDVAIPGREPLRVVELRLRRVGDSAWPSAGRVRPR
jgi:hypothetical protein